MAQKEYRKHFVPLESDPEIFTSLIHKLGVSKKLVYEDIYDLDNPDFHPHPALALILLFSVSEEMYEAKLAQKDAGKAEYEGSGNSEEAVWFKQTIHNACGFYALLHSVSNGEAKKFIGISCTVTQHSSLTCPDSNSILGKLLQKAVPLKLQERALVLEDSKELELAYAEAAKEGQTEAPENIDVDVDFHYLCFVKSDKSDRVFELDGDRKGPVDTGITLSANEDILSPSVLALVKSRFEEAVDGSFSLMVLTELVD
jgi:ubiquitin carboxyl-terminal hydrolase L3